MGLSPPLLPLGKPGVAPLLPGSDRLTLPLRLIPGASFVQFVSVDFFVLWLAAPVWHLKQSSFPEDSMLGEASGDVSPAMSRAGGAGGMRGRSETGIGARIGGAGEAGQGRGLMGRIPRTGVMRTSTKFVAAGDADSSASWEEEFFFARVAGESAVRVVCIDKV